MNIKPLLIPTLTALVLSACGETAKHDISAGMGTQPTLPEPVKP